MSPGARDYPPGARIPGTVYQVVRRIGAGGMGTVYDVEDTTIGKRYVLKALHPQLGNREDLARRMQNEARVLARLHHPNIVEVITAGVTADELRLPYYVMERLDGQPLRLILEKKGGLDLPHALHIAIDLLDALDHAHDKGVIHRDVKPDNIFMHRTSAGITVTKLLDFGIVSLLDAGPRETAGRFLGTLRYAAPEQLRGEDPTPKMDIYCAGLVLYELLAGRGPFDDQGDSTQIAHAHLHRPAPPISKYVQVPRELETMVAAALAKVPDGRPRDAFSFAASLRNLKRALTPERADSTGNRATAPDVNQASAGAPFVDVRRSSPGGGAYVVSPAPASPVSPELVARTTVRGMVAPTLGPPVAPAQDHQITATSAEAVDRQAPTHSLAVPRMAPGSGGTEMLTPGPAIGATQRVHPIPMGVDGVVPMQWQPERSVASSEGAQVRTLAGASSPSGSRAAIVMTVAALLGLVVVGSVLLLVRHGGASRGPSSPAAAVVSVVAPPDPKPVVVIPAPTLAPPALDDVAPPPSATAAGSSPPPAASVPSARPSPRPRSSGRPASSPAAPALTDRPGPGF